VTLLGLGRRMFGLPIVAAALLTALAGWFAISSGVGRLPGQWFVVLATGSLFLFAASVLRLVQRVLSTSPPAPLRPLVPHAESFIFLVAINLVILSPLAPLFSGIGHGMATTIRTSMIKQAFGALGELTGPVQVALFGAGAVVVAWVLILRLLDPLRRLPGVRRLAVTLDRLVVAAIIVFCTGGALLSYNATLDSGAATPRQADLVAVSGLGVPFTGLVLGWADVRYLDGPGAVERILLMPKDEVWIERGAPGLPVRLHMRPGLFGFRWIENVTVDRERELQRTLAAVPTAAALRKPWIEWLVNQRRWNDVRAEAEKHLRACPEDRQFVLGVASRLRAQGQIDHAGALEAMVREQ
jgi:hypothetical protein